MGELKKANVMRWYDTPAPPGTVRYCEHRPGFVTTDEPLEQGTADPPRTLLELPFVARLAAWPQHLGFSLDETKPHNGQRYGYLLDDTESGFWVVAYVMGDLDTLGLPAWDQETGKARMKAAVLKKAGGR